jgi:hypothetical protein
MNVLHLACGVAGRQVKAVDVWDFKLGQTCLEALAVGKGILAATQRPSPPNIDKKIDASVEQTLKKVSLVVAIDADRKNLDVHFLVCPVLLLHIVNPE